MMSRFNFCCCVKNLQNGVKWIAVINLLYTILLIALEIFLCYNSGFGGVEEVNPEFTNPKYTQITLHKNQNSQNFSASNDVSELTDSKTKNIVSIPARLYIYSLIWILSWMIDIWFSCLLYMAAKSKNVRYLKMWFYFRISILVFRIIFLIIYLIAGFPLLSKIPVLILFIIRIYSILVVNSFITQVEEEKKEAKNTKNIETASDNSAYID